MSQQPVRRDVRIFLAGFSAQDRQLIRQALAPHAVRATLDEPGVPTNNDRAMYAVEKKLILTSDVVVVRFEDDDVSLAMQLMLAADRQVVTFAVGVGSDRLAWVAENTVACFESTEELVRFLQVYLQGSEEAAA